MTINNSFVIPHRKHTLHCGLKNDLLVLTCVCLPLILSACAPVIGNTQPDLTEWMSLPNSGNIGQTFVSGYDGLSGIQLWISPVAIGNGKINIHLRSDPRSSENIASSSFPLSNLTNEGMYTFFFEPQNSSRRNYYYVAINISGEGAIRIGAAGGDTYLDGARYQNTIPQNGQLSFRLVYSMRRLGVGLVKEFFIWGIYLLVGAFLFILPGFGLLSIFLPNWDGLSRLEKLGLSSGISLSIYPIFFLWTGIDGLHLGFLYAWIPPILGFFCLLWKYRESITQIKNLRHRYQQFPTVFKFIKRKIPLTEWLPGIVLLLVIGFTVLTRLWAIRTIDAPMWGDSYQHTVIAQRLVENNGLFKTWQPYAELKTFTYHFGFHTTAAVFHWITGVAMPRAILWVGQFINILAILSLYPLVRIISKNNWSGVIAIIVAGLLSPVPMVYTNWGRYTQLAGQVILLTVMYLVWTVFIPSQNDEAPKLPESRSGKRIFLGLSVIALGGLSLTHFRVLFFALFFLFSIFIYYLFSKKSKSQWLKLIRYTMWIGIGSGGIFLPWFINVFGGKILRNFTNQLTTPASSVPIETQSYNSIGNLLQYMPVEIWLLLPIAIAWGLWKRHAGIAMLSAWSLCVLLAANPSWLHLPGAGAISNFAVFIAIYIPASILIGGSVGMFMDTLSAGVSRAEYIPELASGWKARLLRLGVVDVQNNTRLPGWGQAIIAIILVLISFSGLFSRLNDLTPEKSTLLTRPDLRAASWIKDNLHTDAKILVNSFFAYGGSLVVGSDGGWWLPVLTGRQTTLPPLNYGTEAGIRSDYKKWVNELPRMIKEKGLAHPDVLQMLLDRNITQVYIGQKQGDVNNAGDIDLDPQQLSENEHFKEIYHQDRVWIFDVIQTP